MRRAAYCLCWLLLCSTGSFAQPSIIISTGEWPPYIGAMLPFNGSASRIIDEAYASQQIHVDWGFYDWQRAFDLARDGQSDGTAVWSYKTEWAADFYYSAPIMRSGQFFYSLKDRGFDWQTLEDLKGLRIGVTTSYNYGKAMQQAVKANLLSLHPANSDTQNLRYLLNGKIDVFPINPTVAESLLNEHFSPEERARLIKHPKALRSHTLHLLLSRKVIGNQQRLEQFNQGLKVLWQDGRMQRYLQSHELPPREQTTPVVAN